MFEYDIAQRSHFTGKDGEQTYLDWCKKMGISSDDFMFRYKDFGRRDNGRSLSLNVVSWGFYQGSDWRYYVFVSYRSSDNKVTVAYHWDVDDHGKPVGSPRKHQWTN